MLRPAAAPASMRRTAPGLAFCAWSSPSSHHEIDAEHVLLGIEQNGLVPVVVGAIRRLHQARTGGHRERRQAIDLGLACDVDVEQELDAARVRGLVEAEQLVPMRRGEADRALARVEAAEDRRADRLDLLEAEQARAEAAQ